MNEIYEEFLKGVVSLLLKSPLAILCVLMCYAQGVLLLNVIVSFKRKDRKNVYQPLLAIPIGFVFSIIVLVWRNFDLIRSGDFLFETFLNQIFVDEIIAFAIIGAASTIIYVIKEILFMKDGGNNE